MINLSFISKITGTYYQCALWVSNNNNFLKPCRVGDKVKFVAKIIGIEKKHRLIGVEVVAFNQFEDDLESTCRCFGREQVFQP